MILSLRSFVFDENAVTKVSYDKTSKFFESSNSLWKRIPSGSSFNYPIDYWMLILGHDKASGELTS